MQEEGAGAAEKNARITDDSVRRIEEGLLGRLGFH